MAFYHYLKPALIQGIMSGITQYIFLEIDPAVGKILFWTPMALLNNTAISDAKLESYVIAYIVSCAYSLIMGLFYLKMIRSKRISRTIAWRYFLVTTIITLVLLMVFEKML